MERMFDIDISKFVERLPFPVKIVSHIKRKVDFFILWDDGLVLKLVLNPTFYLIHYKEAKERFKRDLKRVCDEILSYKEEILNFCKEMEGYPFSRFYFLEDWELRAEDSLTLEEFIDCKEKIIKFFRIIKRIFKNFKRKGLVISGFDPFSETPERIDKEGKKLPLPEDFFNWEEFAKFKDYKEFEETIRKRVMKAVENFFKV